MKAIVTAMTTYIEPDLNFAVEADFGTRSNLSSLLDWNAVLRLKLITA
jgi:hypothetical protein